MTYVMHAGWQAGLRDLFVHDAFYSPSPRVVQCILASLLVFAGTCPSQCHSSQQLDTKSLLDAIGCAPKAVTQGFQRPLKALLHLICSSLYLQIAQCA